MKPHQLLAEMRRVVALLKQDQGWSDFDRLLALATELGLIDMPVVVDDLHRYHQDIGNADGMPWYFGFAELLIYAGFDRFTLNCDVRQETGTECADERSIPLFAERLAEWLETQVVEHIAAALSRANADRFRWLYGRRYGATFAEFSGARVDGRPLTDSTNEESIKAMLAKLSGQLADHGYQLKVSIPKNRIKLEKYS
jgi:hypothetical protein